MVEIANSIFSYLSSLVIIEPSNELSLTKDKITPLLLVELIPTIC